MASSLPTGRTVFWRSENRCCPERSSAGAAGTGIFKVGGTLYAFAEGMAVLPA